MSKEVAVDILLAAKDRISDPEQWTCNADARDKYNGAVEALSEFAVSWCARGAVLTEAYKMGKLVPIHDSCVIAKRALRKAAETVAAEDCFMRVNDVHGHGTTMEMFDEAIRDLKGQ